MEDLFTDMVNDLDHKKNYKYTPGRELNIFLVANEIQNQLVYNIFKLRRNKEYFNLGEILYAYFRDK